MEFEVNLDFVPGWGDDPQDWVNLINADFLRQKHYFTESRVISIKDIPYFNACAVQS